MLREGGVIASGYDADLDELRRISEHSDEALLELESRERARTGFANLRFGYNRVQGYYIEVSRSQADQVPADWVRRQTVKNAERYITSDSSRSRTACLAPATGHSRASASSTKACSTG